MSEKIYKSIFSPNKEIDISCHITELVLNNKLEWQAKKNGSDPKPKCDFWTEGKASSDPVFKKLQDDFRLEVTYIKNLLKVFSASVVLSYVKNKGIITFRFLPLDKQKTLIYNMFQEQVKFLKHRKELSKKAKKESHKELDFKESKTPGNKISDLL